MRQLINAEKSDLIDVLEFVAFAIKPITREIRVAKVKSKIYEGLSEKHIEFLDFVLSKYIETGVEELEQEKLPDLLTLKYHAIEDATTILGGAEKIKEIFIAFSRGSMMPLFQLIMN